MKELVKPNSLENDYQNLESYNESCTRHCSGCENDGEGCNRYCSDGSNNLSPIEEMDILF